MQIRTEADVLTFLSSQPFMVQGIAFTIIDEARALYEEIGHDDDFGIQHVGEGKIIFGGLNRVHWTPSRGFVCDIDCTENFRTLFNIELGE